MELSRGAQQEGRLAEQARHLPFTRLERRKSLIERGCFSHAAEHKSNSIGATDRHRQLEGPAFCEPV
jgi:hypothetical protein